MGKQGWRGVGAVAALVAFALVGCGPVEEGSAEEAAALGVSEAELVEARGRPCVSSEECPAFLVCSTEQGVCNPPPGCDPSEEICLAVCYGTCVLPERPPRAERCGESVCRPGTYCCNPLRSLCVPYDFACIL